MTDINLRQSSRRPWPHRRPDSPVVFSSFLSPPPDEDEFLNNANAPSPDSLHAFEEGNTSSTSWRHLHSSLLLPDELNKVIEISSMDATLQPQGI